MQHHDGFIDGIFNYCDRWCEACAFTSRCRLFADRAKADAARDPNLKPVVESPPLPEDVPPDPPLWLRELIDELDAAALARQSADEILLSRPRAACDDEPLLVRAKAFCERVHGWLLARGFHDVRDPRDPRAVIGWFHTLVPSKLARALYGLACDDPELRDEVRDHDGSARVALIGIERSHAAFLHLVESGFGFGLEIDGFIADLVWLGEEIERVFPGARSFVRPAFDEPDEVARLLARESAP